MNEDLPTLYDTQCEPVTREQLCPSSAPEQYAQAWLDAQFEMVYSPHSNGKFPPVRKPERFTATNASHFTFPSHFQLKFQGVRCYGTREGILFDCGQCRLVNFHRVEQDLRRLLARFPPEVMVEGVLQLEDRQDRRGIRRLADLVFDNPQTLRDKQKGILYVYDVFIPRTEWRERLRVLEKMANEHQTLCKITFVLPHRVEQLHDVKDFLGLWRKQRVHYGYWHAPNDTPEDTSGTGFRKVGL